MSLLLLDPDLSYLCACFGLKLQIEKILSRLRRLQTLIIHSESDGAENWAKKILLNIQKRDNETKHLKICVAAHFGALPQLKLIILEAPKR